jgi:hypothetical protein
MIKSLKNKVYIAAGFGAFQVLISLFFGSFKFFPTQFSETTYAILIFTSISISELILLVASDRFISTIGRVKIFFCLSFLISGILGPLLIFFLFATQLGNLFIHTISFFIAALVPSILVLLYYLYKDAEEKIATMGKVSLISHQTDPEQQEKVFHLENDNGKLLLEVPIDRIICFEANDNYVITYYLDKTDQLKKSMERVSLKKIEELLEKENVIFCRVHKSYLINPKHLEGIKGKAQAYKLQMYLFDNLIPVSRSYDISILETRSF